MSGLGLGGFVDAEFEKEEQEEQELIQQLSQSSEIAEMPVFKPIFNIRGPSKGNYNFFTCFSVGHVTLTSIIWMLINFGSRATRDLAVATRSTTPVLNGALVAIGCLRIEKSL